MDISADHIDAVIDAMRQAPEPQRSRLRDLALMLDAAHTAKVARAIADTDPMPLLEQSEFDLLMQVVEKGVAHNGLAPTISGDDMGRALRLFGHLLARAKFGSLTQEDVLLLGEIFDDAATQAPYPVRLLEQKVRLGLGLTERLAFSSDLSPDIC